MNGLHGLPSAAAPFAGGAPNGAAPPPPLTVHLPSATRRSVHMAKRAGEGSFGMTLDQDVHAAAADCPRVSYVFPNSAASRAGVRPGWSLELFNGVSCRGRRVSEIAPVFRELQTVTLIVDISTEIAPTATSAYPPQVPAPAPILWPPQPSVPAPSPAATNMAFLAALQSGMTGAAISNAARSSAAMPTQHATMVPPQAVPARAPPAANGQPAPSLPSQPPPPVSQSNGATVVQSSAAAAAPPRPTATSAPPPAAAPPRAAAPPHTATPPQVAPAVAPALVVAARPATAVPLASALAPASTTAPPATATARSAVAHTTPAAPTNPTTTTAEAASASRGKKRSRPQSESSSATAVATTTTTTTTTSTTEAAAGRRRGRQQSRRQSASSVASDMWDSDDAVYFYGSDLDPDVEEVSPPPARGGRNRRTSSRQAESGGRTRRSLTVSRLMTMGFTQQEAELSVESCGDDPDGCMIWIVSYREEKQFLNDLNKASIESENQKRLDAQQQKKEESETLRQATAFSSLFQTSYVLSDLASAPRLQAMLSSTIGDIAADTLMRTLLTKLLTVESKAIRWYKEACKCYMLELAARLEAAFESHDAAVCCSTTLASQPAAEGCAFVRALHEEEQALSKALFLLPENQGGVPLAFLRADESMQFSLDDDGFEVVDQPLAPASPSQD